jgi:transcriptional regulator with XRE-family HTH domain
VSTPLIKDIARQLMVARDAQGLSPAELSERSGWSRATLWRLENGEPVRAEAIVDIAKALGKRLVLEDAPPKKRRAKRKRAA